MRLELYLQKSLSNKYRLPTKKQFIEWIDCALKIIPNTLDNFEVVEITIRLVEEAESARLNQQYRHKSGPTNILSFSAENLQSREIYYLGDLLVCVPLVIKEAKEQGKTPVAHWAHLTVHGILHLLNYDHVLDSHAKVMEELEIHILKQLGYENPYQTF